VIAESCETSTPPSRTDGMARFMTNQYSAKRLAFGSPHPEDPAALRNTLPDPFLSFHILMHSSQRRVASRSASKVERATWLWYSGIHANTILSLPTSALVLDPPWARCRALRCPRANWRRRIPRYSLFVEDFLVQLL